MCLIKALSILGLLMYSEVIYCMPTENSFSATTEVHTTDYPLTRYEQGLEDYDEMKYKERQARGMMDEPEEDYHDHAPMKDQSKATAVDPWANYYDFIINEGSFKFWAVFQLGTALLLIYSAFAAVYYAKFNVSSTDYDYYYDFFARSNTGRSDSSSSSWFGMSPQTFQRIIDSISSKKYS